MAIQLSQVTCKERAFVRELETGFLKKACQYQGGLDIDSDSEQSLPGSPNIHRCDTERSPLAQLARCGFQSGKNIDTHPVGIG